MHEHREAFADALFAGIWIFLLFGGALGALAIHELELRESRQAACEMALKAGQSPARCLEVR